MLHLFRKADKTREGHQSLAIIVHVEVFSSQHHNRSVVARVKENQAASLGV